MATSNMSRLGGTRGAGLSLMTGWALALVASLLFPGGLLIVPVDGTDFARAINVMADYASLAHVTTFLVIVAMLLHGYGFLGLFRLHHREGSLMSPVLRFGIIASLFGWAIFIVGMGKRHMIVHLMQRAMDSGTSPEMAAEFETLAIATYADMAGIMLAFLTIFPFGSALVGLALAARFSGMNVYRLASYGLVVIGVGGLVNFLVVQHAPAVGITLLLQINNTLLLIGGVCLLLIGVGMYRGRSEFQTEGSSS